MQPSKKGKKMTARMTPGRGPPPYRITRKTLGALREPEEDSGEVILAPLEGCDGTKDQDDDVQISKVHDKHPWDVEHANRVLKRTKASYAAHISDLKTDLAATKAMNRELIKQIHDLQMSLRKIEKVLKETLSNNELQERT
ncbi:hypothetical protein EV122DRAFT_223567 [Schizophyllum commune]